MFGLMDCNNFYASCERYLTRCLMGSLSSYLVTMMGVLLHEVMNLNY